MMTMTISSRARASRGFTLLELMVALTVGGIAITSIYAVGAASTRAFHQQQQIASLQSSLRIALGQLKRDFARAGFLATPNIAAGMACSNPGAPLHDPVGNGSLAAIARYDQDFCSNSANGCSNIHGATAATETANRAAGFTADSVVLIGNYETAYEYAITKVSFGNAGVFISPDSHAYRTDFTRWHAGVVTDHDQTAFEDAFARRRLIRIRTPRDFHHFAQVTAAVAPTVTADPEIQFAPALPAGCASETASENSIAPVSAIRYFVRNEVNPLPANADTFGPMAQLVRAEMDPVAKQTTLLAAAPPPRVVLDYVVAFRLAFVMNGATAIGAPDNFVPGAPGTTVATNPERVRAIRIDLAARTPEQDERFPWSQNTCADLQCFRVFDDRPGAARVRAVHAEVFVPNVAFEGY
jgi:prepilin-type N-terminal cleavage/methylation domain-containing protein